MINVIKEILNANANKQLNSVISESSLPNKNLIFNAFKQIPSDFNVVIVGQDPYPIPGIATGIAFGVDYNTPENNIPPSLRVIMDEVALTVRHDITLDENTFDITLNSWINQGVLLINSSLTCDPYKPEGPEELFRKGSHSHYWREMLMEDLFKYLDGSGRIVFSFWGKKAQYYSKFIINNPVINVPHPVSDKYNNTLMFRGSNIFNNINAQLKLWEDPEKKW